jgi:hypothetical protein
MQKRFFTPQSHGGCCAFLVLLTSQLSNNIAFCTSRTVGTLVLCPEINSQARLVSLASARLAQLNQNVCHEVATKKFPLTSQNTNNNNFQKHNPDYPIPPQRRRFSSGSQTNNILTLLRVLHMLGHFTQEPLNLSPFPHHFSSFFPER